MQEKHYNTNTRLIKVLRKIDEVLKRNSIYGLQTKINKLIKFFISIQREHESSVSNFLDNFNSNPKYNSCISPSKSKFFGKFILFNFIY
jgi:hypothetical protein